MKGIKQVTRQEPWYQDLIAESDKIFIKFIKIYYRTCLIKWKHLIESRSETRVDFEQNYEFFYVILINIKLMLYRNIQQSEIQDPNKQMSDHFRYGFTLQAKDFQNIQNDEQSDSLDDLFQVGDKKLIKEKKKDSKEENFERSRSRQKKKKKRKYEEDIKNEKKKQKKEKKEKRQKRGKKKKIEKQQQINLVQSSQQQIKNTGIQKKKQQRKLEQDNVMKNLEIALLKEDQAIQQRRLQIFGQKSDDTLQKQEFVLKYKISRKALPIDIIHFGEVGLEKYGLRDKDIPVYSRPFNFDEIIGWWSDKFPKMSQKKWKRKKNPKRKDKNEMKRIIHEINVVINQRDSINLRKNDEEDGSTNRYYHYEGYQAINCEHLTHLEVQDGISSQNQQIYLIPYSINPPLPTLQQQLLDLNKSYNTKLSQQPKNQSLWMEFLTLQEITYNHTHNNISLINNNKNQIQYFALLDRKISIIKKARLNLPQSQWLLTLEFTATDEMKKERNDLGRLLQPKLCVFDRQIYVPSSIQHFLLYLQIRVNNFAKYSHTYLLSEFQQIKQDYLDYRNKKIYSTKKIQEVRRIEQQLTHRVLKIMYMEGYKQLSICAILASLEFCLFRGNRSFEQYRQFYQNCECLGGCWNNPVLIKEHQQLYLENRYQRETICMGEYLSLHPFFHEALIDQNPTGFLLFDDISPFLTLNRDQNSIQDTIDFLCEILGLPFVFKQHSNQNFIMNWLKNTLFDKNFDKNISSQWKFVLWNKYWPPLLTQQFISSTEFTKIALIINVLQTIYLQFGNPQSRNSESSIHQFNLYPIREYLLFLYCVIHNCSEFVHLMSAQQSLMKIKQLFSKFMNEEGYQKDYYYCRAWAIYIQFMLQFEKSSFKECLECFYACFKGTSIKIIGGLEVLFWIQKFCNYCGKNTEYHRVLLHLLKTVLFEQKLPDFNNLDEQPKIISQMDRLLAGNTLKQLLKTRNTQALPDYLVNFTRIIIYQFLLMLGQNPNILFEKVAPRILTNTKQDKDYGIGRMFLIDLLLSKQLISLQKMKNLDLLKLGSNCFRIKYNIHIKLVLWWLRQVQSYHQLSVSGLLLMIQNMVNSCAENQYSLFVNAITFQFLVTRFMQTSIYQHRLFEDDTFRRMVLLHIKDRFQQKHILPIYYDFPMKSLTKMSEFRLIDSSPILQSYHCGKQLQFLNILLNDWEYSLQSLDKLPYSRQLYRIIATNSQDPEISQKIRGSILEKEIPYI